MRVICIDNKGQTTGRESEWVVIGSIYTVISQRHIKGMEEFEDGLYFFLKEMTGSGYHSILFAPLSEIDETELINERELCK